MKNKSVLILFFLSLSTLFYGQKGNTYENQIFKSKTLSKDVKYNIYFPPEYKHSKKLPIVYYLHGFGGNHFSSETFVKTIDSLISNHSFPQLIIVSPSADKTWYMDDSDGTVKYGTMFIKEFIPYIKDKYPVIDDANKTVITGSSMGGFGALRFSMLYPNIFGISIGFQSAIETDYQFKNMPESDYQKYHEHIYGKKEIKEAYLDQFFYENQPLYMAEKLSREKLNSVKWYIQCCDNDYHSGPNAALHIVFRKKNVKHEYRVFDGKHGKKCVVSGFESAFSFLKKNLSVN